MLTCYDKYRDIVILSSSEPLGRWPEGEKQGSRNVSGMVPTRDKRFFALLRMTLLWRTKVNGAKAHSSGKINLPSSQATLSYRVAVATDANVPRRHSA